MKEMFELLGLDANHNPIRVGDNVILIDEGSIGRALRKGQGDSIIVRWEATEEEESIIVDALEVEWVRHNVELDLEANKQSIEIKFDGEIWFAVSMTFDEATKETKWHVATLPIDGSPGSEATFRVVPGLLAAFGEREPIASRKAPDDGLSLTFQERLDRAKNG